MMHRDRGFNRKGQALVEFALVLPLVLLLVVGMLEFARAWNLHQVMTEAVREGARRAVLADDPACPGGAASIDSVKAPIWRYLQQGGYNPSFSTTTVSPAADFKCSGKNVTVRLVLPYKIWAVGGTAFTMTSSLTVRNE